MVFFVFSLVFSFMDNLWITAADKGDAVKELLVEFPRSYGFLASSVFLATSGILFAFMFVSFLIIVLYIHSLFLS